jgi:hypothetical protein
MFHNGNTNAVQTQTIARADNGKFAPTLKSKKAVTKAMAADAAKKRRLDELEALYGTDDMWLYA